MNAFSRVLILMAVIPCGYAESERIAPVKPQPRVRLQPELLARPVDRHAAAPPAEQSPVTMEKITVTETKLPPEPRRQGAPEPTTFSIDKGGPFAKKQLGGSALEFGLWTLAEVFPEDAEFRPAKTRADVSVVRLRW